MRYEDVVLADAPDLYIPATELTGTTAKNYGAVSGDGTITGVTLGRIPLPMGGYAGYWDGNGDTISVGDNNAWTPTVTGPALTVECMVWCETDGVPNNRMIFSKSGASFSYEWFAEVANATFGSNLSASVHQFSGTVVTRSTCSDLIGRRWRHFAVVYTGGTSTSYPRIYLDGRLLTVTQTAGSGTLSNEAGSIHLGGRGDSFPTFHWLGGLAHWAIYPRDMGGRMMAHARAAFRPPTRTAFGWRRP